MTIQKYESNPIWLWPVFGIGGAVAAYFTWERVKQEIGPAKAGRAISAIPGVAGAAVLQWGFKPKIDKKYAKYMDFSSLALLGYAGYSALTYKAPPPPPPPGPPPEEEMGYKPPGTKTAIKNPSFTNVGAGKILGRNFGIVPMIKVDISEPEIGTAYDAFHFKITNLGGSKNVIWRLEGKPGWGPGGKVSTWATGPKKYMRKGEEWGVTENVYFWTWLTISKEAAKFQYRILLSMDETFKPERLYMMTPWIRHYSE